MKRPSPALVISLIALFVALGGTSYAVTRLPAKSVGAKQLKNGAVTSKKINKSTRKAFSKPGPRGRAGAAGANGGLGPQGPRGETGPIGPSTSYVARFNGTAQTVPASPGARVTAFTQTLPAGSYVVVVTLRALSTGTATNPSCQLEANGGFLDQKNVNLLAVANDRKIVPLQGSATFTTPTDVAVTCDTSGGGAWITDEGRFAAIKVGQLIEDR